MFKFISKSTLLEVIKVALCALCISFIFYGEEQLDTLSNNESLGSFYASEDGRLVYSKARDGHYYIDVGIGQKKIAFLLDTGATSTVICYDDAVKLFDNLKDLLKESSVVEYYNTANGLMATIPVVIESFTVGNFVLNNIQVNISMSSLKRSLLGMNVISALDLSIHNGQMIVGIANVNASDKH